MYLFFSAYPIIVLDPHFPTTKLIYCNLAGQVYAFTVFCASLVVQSFVVQSPLFWSSFFFHFWFLMFF